MNKRLKEFYKMRNRLPIDALQFVRHDTPFINGLDDEDFQYLLDWEYDYAMDNYSRVRADVLNPKRTYSFSPERPKNEEGAPMSGSHEFDTIPTTYQSTTEGTPELLYNLWIHTCSDEEFLQEVERNWDLGNFPESYGCLKDGVELFIRKQKKMANNRAYWRTKTHRHFGLESAIFNRNREVSLKFMDGPRKKETIFHIA